MSKIKRYKLVLIIIVFFGIIGLLLFANTSPVKADDDPVQPLDCLECHQQTLEYHNILGSGNDACWTCHHIYDMSKLRITGSSQLAIDDSNQLCGQCHADRYNDFLNGTHGFSGYGAIGKCTNCHNPHSPQVNLSGITLPHPDPAPPPPGPPIDIVMIVFISVVFMTGLVVFVAKRESE